jgi:chemotaxis signal transduction protein
MSALPSAANANVSSAKLREEFDQAFARQRVREVEHGEDVLAVRLGRDAYALRISEVASVHVGARVVSVPTDLGSLRGIAAFRSNVVAVYDLGSLLGARAAGDPHGPPPAIVLVRARSTVALAVTSVRGYARIDRGRLPVSLAARQHPAHVVGVLQLGDTPTMLVDLSSVLETLFATIDQIATKGSRKDP